jgi:hypothetical protein
MVFFQLTIDSNDPALLVRFWAQALGYLPVPPAEPETTWWSHYQRRLGDGAEFDDRLFDPEGLRPPIWFQEVPEEKAGKNRLHLDIYVTARDDSLPMEVRAALVDTKVDELVALGGTLQSRSRSDEPADPHYFVVMQDPEGNEFCVS